MSTEEKIELSKRIRKLPEEALNRVVEIITTRKLASESSDRITMNLRELVCSTIKYKQFLSNATLLSMPDPCLFLLVRMMQHYGGCITMWSMR
jgi:hypothetical protein